MSTEHRQSFKQKYLRDFKTVVYTISALLIVALGVTLYAIIDKFSLGWLKPVVAFLLTLILLLLNAQSPFFVRLFKRLRLNLLFPVINEMIANQERCDKNHAVIDGMERALTFYRLWDCFDFSPVSLPPEPSRFSRWGAKLVGVWYWLRRQPAPGKPPDPQFHPLIFAELPLVDDENERIRNCAAAVDRYKQETATYLSPPLLELLFRERAKISIGPFTESVEQQLAADLAQLLSESRLLLFGYQGKLKDLLLPLREYDFHHLEAYLAALRTQNHLVVEKMGHMLAYYKIADLTPAEQDTLTNFIPAADNDNDRITNCSQQVIHYLTDCSPKYSANLIELLYRERYQLPTLHLQLNTDVDLIAPLAQVLYKSKRLPIQTDLPLETGDIERILGNLADFTLNGVFDQMLAYQSNRREDRTVIRNMLHVLVYYDLLKWLDEGLINGLDERGNVCLQADFEQLLQNRLFPAEDLDDRITTCAEVMLSFIISEERPHCPLLLEILYRERYGLPPSPLSPDLISELAQVLVLSGRLPAQDKDLPPYEAVDIARLLFNRPEFTLGQTIDDLNLFQTRRRENLGIVSGMERILTFFNIFPHLKTSVQSLSQDGCPSLREPFRNQLINSLPTTHTQDALIQNCAANVAQERRTDDSPITPTLLSLLYREYHKLDKANVWPDQTKRLLSPLAEILHESGHLSDAEQGFPCQPAELRRVFSPLRDFSLVLVNEILECLGFIWQSAAGYHTFLAENGITGWVLDKESFLKRIEQTPPGLPADAQSLRSLQKQHLGLLRWLGEESIAAAFPELSLTHQHSISLIALAIYLAKFERYHAELLVEVCQLVAQNNDAVLMALAYLEFRADIESGVRELAGHPFVSVAYLIAHWQERIQEKRQELEGFTNEVNTIQQALAEGQWLTRLWQMLEQTWRNLSQENERLHKKVEENKAARQAAETAFKREVRIETLERFLEARTVNAYLLAFDARQGRLAGLIDCLRLRPLGSSTSQISGRKPTQKQRADTQKKLQILADHHISLTVEGNGEWKYHFAQYTDNTRIGVVPYGWTLEQFYREFDRDLRELADKTTVAEKTTLVPDYEWNGGLDRTEIILHRFGLRNHHVVRLARRSQTAVTNMLELFASQLKDHDLVASIGYGQDDHITPVDATLAAGVIADFAADSFRLQPMERKQLEQMDELLKKRLLERLNMKTIPELGQRVVQEAKTPIRAKKALAKLLAVHIPQLKGDQKRAGEIAAAYLKTLHDIAVTAY